MSARDEEEIDDLLKPVRVDEEVFGDNYEVKAETHKEKMDGNELKQY